MARQCSLLTDRSLLLFSDPAYTRTLDISVVDRKRFFYMIDPYYGSLGISVSVTCLDPPNTGVGNSVSPHTCGDGCDRISVEKVHDTVCAISPPSRVPETDRIALTRWSTFHLWAVTSRTFISRCIRIRGMASCIDRKRMEESWMRGYTPTLEPPFWYTLVREDADSRRKRENTKNSARYYVFLGISIEGHLIRGEIPQTSRKSFYQWDTFHILDHSSFMTFEYPLFLILLLFIPFFAVWESRIWNVGQRGLHPLFIRYMTRKPWEVPLLTILKCSILWASILLLGGPVAPEVRSEQVKNGIDIQLVLDISRSMLAEDITPNRLTVAKDTIVWFLEKNKSDRIGLVIFAGKPFTVSPLSFDISIVKRLLEGVSVGTILQTIPWLAGTSIGDALLVAGENFGSWYSSLDRERVIILMTDGRANIGVSPILVAKLLREKHIRTYVIGIGSASGTELYTTDNAGNREYFRDATGVPLRADFDEPMMREIARITGWKYWNASQSETLSEVFFEIRRLTEKPIIYERVEYHVPLHRHFLLSIMLILLLVVLLEIWMIRKWKIPFFGSFRFFW